jgi:serine/threonine protein kinase
MITRKISFKKGDLFLKEDYRLEAKLGEGGMGQVWAAIELYSGNLVAIKLLHDQGGNFPLRFRQECRFYTKLRHPNIVSMFKAGEDEHGVMYIIMDLLQGKTVRKVLQTLETSKRRGLEVAQALHLAIQLADAGEYMHGRGVWHRDLKPENLMVGTKAALKGHLWVFDFGIAKFENAEDQGLNSDELPDVATVRYMAPEQVDLTNRANLDGRADIYSFGAILYELITRRHIFIRENEPTTAAQIMYGHTVAAVKPIPDLVPDCPEDVWQLVERCLAKDPKKRYQRFGDVAADLRGMIRGSLPPEHYIAKRVKQQQLHAARVDAFADVQMEDGRSPEGPRFEASEGESAAGENAPRIERITAPMPPVFVPPARVLPFGPSPEPPKLGRGHTERMPSAAALWAHAEPPMPAPPKVLTAQPWSPRFGPPPPMNGQGLSLEAHAVSARSVSSASADTPPPERGRVTMIAPAPAASPPAPDEVNVEVNVYAPTEPMPRKPATPPTSLTPISIMTMQPMPTPTLRLPAPVPAVATAPRRRVYARAVAIGLMISVFYAGVAVVIRYRAMFLPVPAASNTATAAAATPRSMSVAATAAPTETATAAAPTPTATSEPTAEPIARATAIPAATAAPVATAMTTPKSPTTSAPVAAARPAPAASAAMTAVKRAPSTAARKPIPLLFELPEQTRRRLPVILADDPPPPRPSPSSRRSH